MFRVTKSHEIWHRDDFVLLCMWRRLDRVIEIGVDRAQFANTFLSRWWNGSVYLGVDPYLAYDEIGGSRDADLFAAMQRFANYADIARLVRMGSVEYAIYLKNCGCPHLGNGRKFDFIYIDANHTYEAVKIDIETWWPFVSDRGLLAGHDYCTNDHPGVVQAVNEFAQNNDLEVFLTHEHPNSWYIYKTGYSLDWKRVKDDEVFR